MRKDEYSLEEERGHSHCLCCGTEIYYGRKDKKFCSAQCKDKYHNFGKHHFEDARMKIHRAMHKNYMILNDLLRAGVSQIPLSDMVAMGFNPEYVTSYSKLRSGVLLSCYDISFKLSDSRVFNIRRISLTLRQIKNEK